jgi:hypothetical protein
MINGAPLCWVALPRDRPELAEEVQGFNDRLVFRPGTCLPADAWTPMGLWDPVLRAALQSVHHVEKLHRAVMATQEKLAFLVPGSPRIADNHLRSDFGTTEISLACELFYNLRLLTGQII